MTRLEIAVEAIMKCDTCDKKEIVDKIQRMIQK